MIVLLIDMLFFVREVDRIWLVFLLLKKNYFKTSFSI